MIDVRLEGGGGTFLTLYRGVKVKYLVLCDREGKGGHLYALALTTPGSKINSVIYEKLLCPML